MSAANEAMIAPLVSDVRSALTAALSGADVAIVVESIDCGSRLGVGLMSADGRLAAWRYRASNDGVIAKALRDVRNWREVD